MGLGCWNPRGKIPGGPLPPAEVTSVWSELEDTPNPPPPSGYWQLSLPMALSGLGQKNKIRAESLGSQLGRWVCTLPSELLDF